MSPGRSTRRSPRPSWWTFEEPGEDDVEAVARLALADDGLSGRHVLALHPPGERHELLAGQAGEELDAGQLVDGRGNVARAQARLR